MAFCWSLCSFNIMDSIWEGDAIDRRQNRLPNSPEGNALQTVATGQTEQKRHGCKDHCVKCGSGQLVESSLSLFSILLRLYLILEVFPRLVHELHAFKYSNISPISAVFLVEIWGVLTGLSSLFLSWKNMKYKQPEKVKLTLCYLIFDKRLWVRCWMWKQTVLRRAADRQQLADRATCAF